MKVGVLALVNERTMPIDTLAVEIEARGLESLFIGEHSHLPVASRYPIHDALPDLYKLYPSQIVLLSVAAAVTSRLRLGTSVCLPALHDPLWLAKEIATLDHVSRGRVVFGIGYGWNRAEALHHGVAFDERRRRLRESVRAITRIWGSDVASFHGEYVSFGDSWAWPKPVQRPRPPILLGASAGASTFSDIVELADGWLPSSMFHPDLSRQVSCLQSLARRRGRDPSELRHTYLGADTALSHINAQQFRDQLPSARDIEGYSALGIERFVAGIPLFSRDMALRVLDELSTFAEDASES
jgi:probable F420-dependent oxidoreductase